MKFLINGIGLNIKKYWKKEVKEKCTLTINKFIDWRNIHKSVVLDRNKTVVRLYNVSRLAQMACDTNIAFSHYTKI